MIIKVGGGGGGSSSYFFIFENIIFFETRGRGCVNILEMMCGAWLRKG